MRESAWLLPTRRLVLLAAVIAASLVFLVATGVWGGIAGAGKGTGHGVSLDGAKLTASVTYAQGGNGNGNGNGNGGNNNNNNNQGGGTATPEPPSGVLFLIGLVPLATLGVVLTLVRRRPAASAPDEE